MSSLPTNRLRLPKQATGDNPNAWGPVLNGLFDLVDDSQGSVTVAVNGNVTLTNDNYVANQARYAAVRTTGTGLAGNAPALVTVPAIDKWRIVKNDCAGDITIGTGTGLAATVRAGRMSVVLCDGTDTFVIDPALDQVRKPTAAVDFNGQRATNGADGINPTDFATVRQSSTTQAADSAAAAANSATLAQKWATQISPEVVTGQGFGARKYAIDAAASAAAAATFDPNNFDTRTEAVQRDFFGSFWGRV